MRNKYKFSNTEIDPSLDENIQGPNFVISEIGDIKKNNSRFFNIAKTVLMVTISTSLIFFVVKAAPPLNKYNPGETLDPDCSPGDTNCTVVTPAVSGENSDITSLAGMTTALSVGQGGTGLSTIPTDRLLYTSALDTLASLSLDSTLGISSGVLSVQDNSITGAKIALGSDAQGDIMYYSGTDWVRLGAGSSGQYLQTQGMGANPLWSTLAVDVLSVFGRTGDIVATTNDYTWAQINKTTSSLADITTRSAGDLSSGNLGIARMPLGGAWDITSDLNVESNSLFVGAVGGSYAGKIGVGTATPSAKFNIKGDGTGSGKAFEISNSSDVSKFLVQDDGRIGLFGDTPNDGWLISGDYSTSASGNLYGYRSNLTRSAAYSGSTRSVLGSATYTSSGDSSAGGYMEGVRGVFNMDGTGKMRTAYGVVGASDIDVDNATVTNLIGVEGRNDIFGDNDVVTNAIGGNFYVLDISSSGTAIANASAVKAFNYFSEATVENAYGINMSDWTNSGTVNTSYGLYMDNSIDVGTTRYAIYSGSASDSYFASNVGIGTTTPDRLLHAEVSDAVTNAVTYGQRISHITSGTAAASFGTGIEFELEGADGTNNVLSSIQSIQTDATTAAEEGELAFLTADIGDDGLAERMRIDKDGNVGIGTTDPSEALDVIGSVELSTSIEYSGAAASGLQIRNIENVFAGISFTVPTGASTGVSVNGNGGAYVRTDGTSVSPFYIQGTFNPGSGASDFIGANISPIINQSGTSSGNYTGLLVNITETSLKGSDNRLIDLQAGGSSKFIVTNDGNAGIGTTTPADKLTLYNGDFKIEQGNPSDVAFLTDGGGSNPRIDNPLSFYVSGKYVYIGSGQGGGGQGFEVVDISDPTSPSHAGWLADGSGSAPYFEDPRDIYISGQYAYSINGNSSGDRGLEIVDISNNGSPSHAGWLVDGGGSAPYLDDPEGIYISGKYAYIINGSSSVNEGLEVVDISDPTSPSHAGFLADGGGMSPYIDDPLSVFVFGKYVYIGNGSGGSKGLEVVDISNPSSPSHAGWLADGGGASTPYIESPIDIYMSGKYVYIINGSSATGKGIEVVDISDPTSPSHAGWLSNNANGGGSVPYLDDARSFYVSGKYAYIANGNSGTNKGIEVVDISDPTSPSHAGFLADGGASAPYLDDLRGIYVYGKYAYIINGNSSSDKGLGVVDISGVDIPSANIGSILANNVDISENLTVSNNAYINNALNVGIGGIFSVGSLSVSTTSVPSYFGGDVGIGTIAPDKKLEINKSTGGEIRLTYNDSNGSATDYVDMVTDSDGGFTLTTVDSDGAAGNIVLSSDGGLVYTPSSAQVIDAVGDTILANAIMIILNPDGDYTMTSTPTIADGTTGQVLYITCANNEANTVSVQDQDSLASSNLQLGAASRDISGKDVLTLLFDGTDWVEISYANN